MVEKELAASGLVRLSREEVQFPIYKANAGIIICYKREANSVPDYLLSGLVIA